MKRLFIAEKPSMAEHIAAALGEMAGEKPRRGDGAWEVGGDAVAWLFGHMYELAEPKSYKPEWERWNLESLPIVVPDGQWRLVVSEGDDKDFNARVRGQISKIKSMLGRAARVVNAGDPAREGQLLVDELLAENGVDPFAPNVERLWVQSMARKDMIAALSALRPNADKRGLYDSGVCRQRADWQHGMSFSRLYTVLARNAGKDTSISVGRVQTPTLRIVVDRDRERIAFRPVDHFLPRVVFRHERGPFRANWVVPQECEGLDPEGRLVSRAAAQAILERVAGRAGRVSGWRNEAKSVTPPLPFSLSTLQTSASAKLGMTAKEVLDVAQSLYEKHKATTYPRTDSQHLPMAIWRDEARGILRELAGVPEMGEASARADPSLRSGAWDDAKVTDHHGIIPTSDFRPARLEAMNPQERAVFLMIAKAFLAQFFPAHRYRAVTADVLCEGESFRAAGRVQVDPGWRAVYGAAEEDEENDTGGSDRQTLPEMAKGDPVVAAGEGADLNPRRTSPPPAFTDGTLVAAMENIHRFVTDEAVRRRLRENSGIGTPATRADVIQTLLRRKFLERKGKNGLASTEFGRSVIDALPEELKDPGMTALWEDMFSRVEAGEVSVTTFLEQQAGTISRMVKDFRGRTLVIKGVKGVRPMDGDGKPCPRCGSGTMVTLEIRKEGPSKGKRYLRCSNREGCDNVDWGDPKAEGDGLPCPKCGKGVLTTRTVRKEGPNKGKVFLVCSTGPEACDHRQWPGEDGRAAPPPDPIAGHGKPCPKCGKGRMVTRVVRKDGPNKGKAFLSCDAGEACRHAEWLEDNVAPLLGHGQPCPKCGKGTRRTREITAKKDGRKHRLLECSAKPACDWVEWENGPKK